MVLLLCGASFVVLATLLWTDRRRVERNILRPEPPNTKVNYLKASWPKTSKSNRRSFGNRRYRVLVAAPRHSSSWFKRRLRFLATRLYAIRFLWPRPPQSDDASNEIACSRLVGSRLRKKRARVKAQTLQVVVETPFRMKTENAGIWSGLALFLQGGALGALPR